MRTQYDDKVRVVSLDNLKAMCARISGHAHVYEVSKVTRSRVHVTYSNPTEYGTPRPMTAVFPTYPLERSWVQGEPANDHVVLDIMRVTNDTWDGEGWQAFHLLLDCPKLWRSPHDGKWRTEEEAQKLAADTVGGETRTCDECYQDSALCAECTCGLHVCDVCSRSTHHKFHQEDMSS